jgi:predicted metal-dependent phosphoesterase TrpH
MHTLLKVDFHCHTFHSPDSLTSIHDLIKSARGHGLDRVVVTDHNCLAGALEAHAAAPELVIVGEEVQTTEGEFLAAFVTREVPKRLEPMEALKRLRDQGAFISVSHPFDPQRSGWSLESLIKIAPLVDAIEVFNARVLNRANNTDAEQFAREHLLPGTAGSDGHHPSEIGRAYSLVPDFADAANLRIAIRQATTAGKLSSPLVHFYSSWARIVKANQAIKSR